jgi:heptosyltransferase-3
MSLRERRWLSILDRYIGIPMVYAMGVGRRKRPFDERIWAKRDLKLALIKTGAIGDLILLSAIIKEIRLSSPLADITLIASCDNAQAVPIIGGIDRSFIFDMTRPFLSIRRLRGLGDFDLLMDFSSWMRITACISALVKSSLRVGFKRKGMFRHFIYDLWVEHSDEVHEIDNYRNILRVLMLEPRGVRPEVLLHPRILPDDARAGALGSRIVIHMFSSKEDSLYRGWPEKKWLVLVSHLIQKRFTVFLTGGAGDVDAAASFVEKLKKTANVVNMVGRLDLEQSVALIKDVSLLVSVNTGIMHLGAAAGVPLISLHGPTSPRRWGPLSSETSIDIVGKLPCVPCLSLGFEHKCKNGGCMDTISVEEVETAINRLATDE